MRSSYELYFKFCHIFSIYRFYSITFELLSIKYIFWQLLRDKRIKMIGRKEIRLMWKGEGKSLGEFPYKIHKYFWNANTMVFGNEERNNFNCCKSFNHLLVIIEYFSKFLSWKKYVIFFLYHIILLRRYFW